MIVGEPLTKILESVIVILSEGFPSSNNVPVSGKVSIFIIS